MAMAFATDSHRGLKSWICTDLIPTVPQVGCSPFWWNWLQRTNVLLSIVWLLRRFLELFIPETYKKMTRKTLKAGVSLNSHPKFEAEKNRLHLWFLRHISPRWCCRSCTSSAATHHTQLDTPQIKGPRCPTMHHSSHKLEEAPCSKGFHVRPLKMSPKIVP